MFAVCMEDRVRATVPIAEDSDIVDNPNPTGLVPDSEYNGSVRRDSKGRLVDRRRGGIGLAMGATLVGEMAMGMLNAGSEGEENESYEIRSSSTATCSFSFSADLGQ